MGPLITWPFLLLESRIHYGFHAALKLVILLPQLPHYCYTASDPTILGKKKKFEYFLFIPILSSVGVVTNLIL